MSIETVREYLQKFGVQNRILELDKSSATVELAAKALCCKPCQIAKTMAFVVGDRSIVIVVRGDARIDNAKYKKTFHKKAKMISSDKVEEKIGHAQGGICPFALKDGVEVYLDVSLRTLGCVYPACGTENSAILVTIDELEQFSRYKEWVDICKSELRSAE